MNIDYITGIIIDEAMDIHKDLGPGFLASVYESVLFKKLTIRGLEAAPQKPISFEYEGIYFDNGFRCAALRECLQRVVNNYKPAKSPLPGIYKKAGKEQ